MNSESKLVNTTYERNKRRFVELKTTQGNRIRSYQFPEIPSLIAVLCSSGSAGRDGGHGRRVSMKFTGKCRPYGGSSVSTGWGGEDGGVSGAGREGEGVPGRYKTFPKLLLVARGTRRRKAE